MILIYQYQYYLNKCIDILEQNGVAKSMLEEPIIISEDEINLREERTVYSYTAWSYQQETNTPIKIEVRLYYL